MSAETDPVRVLMVTDSAYGANYNLTDNNKNILQHFGDYG